MTYTFAAAFPSELGSQSEAAVLALNLSSDYDYGRFSLSVLGETLLIPRRVFSRSIKPDLSGLSWQQRQIAQCIRTRSTDGFERQAALEEVLAINAPWSIPFVIALIGEYVIQIIDDVYAVVPQFDPDVVAQFIRDNPGFYQLTRDRVTSYWNCYYRQFQRSDYVGFKLLRELEAMRSVTAKRSAPAPVIRQAKSN